MNERRQNDTPAAPRPFRPYPAYKPSGVEWLVDIPEHWGLVPAKRLFDNVVEKGLGRGLPCVDLENIESNSGTLIKGFEWAEKVADDYAVFKPGDVLFGKLRPYLAKYLLVDREGCCPTELMIFRTADDTYSNEYLYRVIQSRFFISLAISTSYGTKMPRTSWDKLSQQYFWLPPPDEQRAISAFLDRETAKIDALVAKKERLVELLEERRTALISRAVTRGLDPNVPMKDSGVEWLGEIPEGWEVRRLRYLCNDIIAGPFGSSITKDSYTEEGYRVYGQEQVIPANFSIGDYYISEAKFNTMRKYEVEPGDVLISCVGTFGKVAVVPDRIEPGIINPRLIKLIPRLDDIIPSFLGVYLKSEVSFNQMEKVSRGGTMGVINIGLLSSIIVPLPPLNEQADILSFLDRETARIDALVAKIREGIEKLKEYRTALISAAVTGKIDVRGETNGSPLITRRGHSGKHLDSR